jgi:hypothetical protein
MKSCFKVECFDVEFSMWRAFFLDPIPPDIGDGVKFSLWRAFFLDPIPPDITIDFEIKDEILAWLDKKLSPELDLT